MLRQVPSPHYPTDPDFAAKVDSSGGPSACWPWLGGRSKGYGVSRVKMNGRWRGCGAHQVANYLATGRWERGAARRCVRHLCHNRLCCNPAHLLAGTPADNSHDSYLARFGVDLVAEREALAAGRRLLVLPVVGVAL